MRVGIYIYDGVEVLDFCGPYEVFGVTRLPDDQRAFHTFTVAESMDPITANTGLIIQPNYSFAICPPLDILLVPGGDSGYVLNNKTALQWLAGQAATAAQLLSVCTGALVYGELGLLDGLESTTHYSAYDRLEQIAPQTTVRRGARWIDNGRVVTSAGVSAGIDMALHVVSRELGAQVARETARYMEYDFWPPE